MISVVIPTLNAARLLPCLVKTLRCQTVKNLQIIVVDSASDDGTAELAKSLGCNIVLRIDRGNFDHGATRNYAVERADGDVLVFLTQDALPISETFVQRLIAPIDGTSTAAAYARQIASHKALPTEVFARSYNYPRESSTRHISSIRQRTLQSFFFSNSASALSRKCFEEVGRFPCPVPCNEDMLLCAKLLDAGYQIAYVADAEVLHSHELSFRGLFHRYFRIGMMVEQRQDILRHVHSSQTGTTFVREQLAYLRRMGLFTFFPRCIAEAVIRATAYQCGKTACLPYLRHR